MRSTLIDTANTGCGAVDTSTLGTHAVTCTATDRAGNVTTAQASYDVVYSFTGFSNPITNLPALNDRKAGTGKAVPLRFSVSNANGPVTDLTSVEVTATSLDCNAGVIPTCRASRGPCRIEATANTSSSGRCRRATRGHARR